MKIRQYHIHAETDDDHYDFFGETIRVCKRKFMKEFYAMYDYLINNFTENEIKEMGCILDKENECFYGDGDTLERLFETVYPDAYFYGHWIEL